MMAAGQNGSDGGQRRPAEEELPRLWLWRNGSHEYWAFEHLYPIHMDNGDPQVIGEPCGYAILKPSRRGRMPTAAAAEAERSRIDWRTIDTAPMTGETVDLWCRRSWDAPVQFVRKVDAYWCRTHKCWRTRGHEHYVELTFRHVEGCDNHHLIPTHWRPLPWGPKGEPI
jgi:hypothetical protein